MSPSRFDTAVLALDAGGAEWLDDRAPEAPVHRTIALANGDSRSAAAEIADALGSTRAQRCACVLALGHGWIEQRVLELPALSKRELAGALARKGANLLACEVSDVLFTARPLSSAPNSDASFQASTPATTRWMLAAMRRSKVVPFLTELRDRGLRVRRIASSNLAVLCAADGAARELEGACIVVGVERRTVSISLLAAGELVNQALLEGDLAEHPKLAMSVLQEVRSSDAFWRRASRGGAVGTVVLAGFERDRGELFKTAVQSALPAAQVHLGLGTPEGSHAHRIEMLRLSLRPAASATDLSVPLPWPKRTGVAIAIGTFTLAITIGAVSRARIARERDELDADNQRLVAQTAELETLRSENARIQSAIDALESSAARARLVHASAWSLTEIVEDSLAAFGSDGALLSLSMGRPDREGDVSITGVTSPDPLEGARRVERILARLDASPRFEALEALPASGPAPAPVLAFTIRARAQAPR